MELDAIYQRLRDRDLHSTVYGSMVEQLVSAAKLIEIVHRTAAEMQLGAEGFDNTENARLYAEVQEHLLAAAQQLVETSRTLNKWI